MNNREANCLHKNGEGRTVYEKLKAKQLCEIASCPSRAACDKATYGVANRPLVDIRPWCCGYEGHPSASGREGHGGGQ